MTDGVDTQRQTDHLSRLVTWTLNTIGKALALSLLVTFVVAVTALLLQLPLLWLAGMFGALTFAAVLYNASAPLEDD